MRRFPHFSTLIFLEFVLFTRALALPNSIWHVSIDEGPAPSPEDGPPLAASAIRDKSFLPAQIGGIIGAYVVFVLVIGIAILFVGRRFRRAAQASPRTLAMEMLKPIRTDASKAFDPSPISPSTNAYGPSPVSTVNTRNAWPSPEKSRSSQVWSTGHKQQPSVQSSVVTFDENVIEDDKARNQREMERLYEAVMEQDEQKSSSALDVGSGSKPQIPSELQHLRNTPGPSKPSSPPPRAETKSPSRNLTRSPLKSGSRHPKPSPISIDRSTTHSQASSRTSFGSFSRKRGIRGLPISPPMGSPDLAPDYETQYGEAQPLSPRFYQPGPPPPPPPKDEESVPQNRENGLRKMNIRDSDSQSSSQALRNSIPTIHANPEADGRTALQHQHDEENGPQRLYNKTKRTPAPLSIRTQTAPGPASHNSLHTAPLPFRNLDSYSDRPRSTIKATVLERKAPNPNYLRSPQTGVPMTPYSPYMPFTPLTPMTPSRLVTRGERKKREREEGRRVATMEDAVVEESDMWGDAYH